MVVQLPCKLQVVGSIPTSASCYGSMAKLAVAPGLDPGVREDV